MENINGASGLGSISDDSIYSEESGSGDPGYIQDMPEKLTDSTVSSVVISKTNSSFASAVGEPKPVVAPSEEDQVAETKEFSVKLDDNKVNSARSGKAVFGVSGKSVVITGKSSAFTKAEFSAFKTDNSKLVSDSGKSQSIKSFQQVSKTGDREAIDSFKRIDLNGDGRISYKEMLSENQKYGKAFLENHKGLAKENGEILTKKEAEKAGLADEYNKVDFNKDGKIDYSEVKLDYELRETQKYGKDFLKNHEGLAKENGEILTKKEAEEAGLADEYNKVDLNSNGIIEGYEIMMDSLNNKDEEDQAGK